MKTNFIKTVGKIALILVPAITLSMNASAHDPKMHAKKAEKADCSKMDHSKMDMKDPVAVAMMKKCMKQSKSSMEKMDHSKMKEMDHSKMKGMDHSKMEKKENNKANSDDHQNH
jgi:ethanolamine utilization protein EutQ (cupin superfamily)